jgi:hypothetical protein
MRSHGANVTLSELGGSLALRKSGVVSGSEAGMLLANISLGSSVPLPMRHVRAGKARVVSRLDDWTDWQDRTNSWDYLRSLAPQAEVHVESLRTNLLEADLVLALDYTNAWRNYYPVFLQPGRAAAQTLGALALLAMHDRDSDLALRRLLLIEGIDRVLRGQPMVPFQWLRSVVGNQLCGNVWEATRQEGWTEGQLARLQEAIEGLHYMEDYARAIEAERVVNNSYFDRLRSGFGGVEELVSSRGGGNTTAMPGNWGELVEVQVVAMHQALRVLAWRGMWSYQDQLFYNRNLQSAADALRAFASGAISWNEAVRRDMTRQWERIDGPYNKLRYMVTPVVAGSFRTGATAVEIETRTRLAMVALAIRRYQLANGALPAALTDLVPRFLRAVPRDVYADKPLCYRALGGEDFLLYSAGDNGKDDGASVEGGFSDFRSLWGNQDVVWPRVATAEDYLRRRR